MRDLMHTNECDLLDLRLDCGDGNYLTILFPISRILCLLPTLGFAPKYIISLIQHGSVASVYGLSIKRISGVVSAEEIEFIKNDPWTLKQASLDMMDPLLGISWKEYTVVVMANAANTFQWNNPHASVLKLCSSTSYPLFNACMSTKL